MSYVYIQYAEQDEKHNIIHWSTVGFYKPNGEFEPDSDHLTVDEAAARVHYLNGGIQADQLDTIASAAEWYLERDR